MGGHQERNKRAGTENVAGIVGIGTAVNLIYNEFDSYNNKLKYLRDYYITQIEKNIPNIKLNGDKVKRLPGNANISFDGIDAGQLLLNLDAYGICASAGSACTSGSLEPSHVLIAIGLKGNLAQGALRTTFGKDNTKEDVDFVCTEQIENRIFDMTQAVAEGKTQYALELYADLLALKEPGMRILFLIARQMNQLLCVKEMEVGRQNKDQIAAALKVRSFVVNKLLGQARQFTIDQLIRCVERCVELEEAVKRGNMNERIAVEMVLLSIANREYHA